MRNIFLVLGILLTIGVNVFAQTVQQCQTAQTDAANQTTAISLNTAAIATAQTALNNDNAIIASCLTQYAQTTSGWNFALDAQLEAAGCRWAACFPLVFPNANLTAIQNQLIGEGLTCPVAETSVTWNNWPAYSAIHGSTDASWIAFYCGQGPAS